MTNPIVTINVTIESAPAPVTLQRTGAIISQGGTTYQANSLNLVTQLSDLTPNLATAKALTSLAWSGSVVTGTTTSPHGWTNGDVVQAVVAGAVPAGYNGTFPITITGASTFTYPLVSNPGSETVPGTVILADEAELLSQVSTFFGQGSGLSVYVLELGEGTPTEGVTSLTTWLTNNPGTIYSFLVPREWDANAGFLTLLSNYKTPTSKTYFYVTTTTGNYSHYSGTKCVNWLVEAPGIPATEFSIAAEFWASLKPRPSSTNPVGQLEYQYMFGVTPWPAAGNSSTLTAIKQAGGNYMGSGPQGGASNVILIGGQFADSNPWKYWYSIDWAQLNLFNALQIAVVNGSNTNPPLQYDQPGINTLQNTAVSVYKQGLAAGLAVGNLVQTQLDGSIFLANLQADEYDGDLVVNAVPWLPYTTENPGNYADGFYDGLTGTWTPLVGFDSVAFNLNVVSL